MELNIGDVSYSTPRRNAYAATLELGSRLAFFLLLITFILYITGIVEPSIPLHHLPSLWSLSATEYLHHTGVGSGWSWIFNLHHGDVLNILPIAILGSLTIICYLTVLPFFIRERDRYLTIFALVEIVVLLLAASGLVSGGH